jgi:hypothetical protein
MNKHQIEMLRSIVKQEIEAAAIDSCYEHGVWGWAEKQLDEDWEKLQQSFNDPDEQEYKSFDTIEELFEDLHADERLWLKKRLDEEDQKEQISEEENLRRFEEVMKWINNLQPGELAKLMGKEFMEEFKRLSQC